MDLGGSFGHRGHAGDKAEDLDGAAPPGLGEAGHQDHKQHWEEESEGVGMEVGDNRINMLQRETFQPLKSVRIIAPILLSSTIALYQCILLLHSSSVIYILLHCSSIHIVP